MKIGTSGSRTKPTQEQVKWFLWRIQELNATELHHGDCVGWDEIADYLASKLGIKRIAHPPTDPKYRAFCKSDEIRPEFPYLTRNHHIIDETEILLACPNAPETLRSGTWATVRYARKMNKLVEYKIA